MTVTSLFKCRVFNNNNNKRNDIMKSIIERIRLATTNVELANLATELATFKFISPATKRKALRELAKATRKA